MKKFFLLILAAISAAFVGIFWYLETPRELAQAPTEFTLEQGGFRHTARKLEEAGLIGNARAFELLARLLGKDSMVKAGSYEFEHGLTPLELLARITKGDNSWSEITFVEGWTFSEMRKAIDSNPDLRHDSTNLSDSAILSRIGAQESSPEGLFFPDTYFFAKGQSDFSVLERAYQSMNRKFGKEWESRQAGLPFSSPYQALILASIIEKETGKSSDRPMISAVFVNRLKAGMKLQTDPSVIYGMGKNFDGNLRKRDLLSDQPYNTYTRAGLPPTPISMPGIRSLDAALHPAKSKALYFVARGDGSSYFSNTLEEHNRAVNRYQKK